MAFLYDARIAQPMEQGTPTLVSDQDRFIQDLVFLLEGIKPDMFSKEYLASLIEDLKDAPNPTPRQSNTTTKRS